MSTMLSYRTFQMEAKGMNTFSIEQGFKQLQFFALVQCILQF